MNGLPQLDESKVVLNLRMITPKVMRRVLVLNCVGMVNKLYVM